MRYIVVFGRYWYCHAFIHFGNDEYDPTRVKEIKNQPGFPMKPAGGFWASEFHPENDYEQGYYSSWQAWCNCEGHSINEIQAVVFKLADNARVYVIDTEQDMLKLFEQYPYDLGYDDGYQYVDWEAMSKNYDAVVLTEAGAHLGHAIFNDMEVNESVEHALYPWDVECICIFNPDIVEQCRALSEIEAMQENTMAIKDYETLMQVARGHPRALGSPRI